MVKLKFDVIEIPEKTGDVGT